jgi:hypothetical protein
MGNNKPDESILAQSVRTGDTHYITEFLLLPDWTKQQEIERLSDEDKKGLLGVLSGMVRNRPLRTEVLGVAKILLLKCDGLLFDREFCKGVDSLCKAISTRTVDYSKLIYLKGKIDYLCHCESDGDNKVDPEHTHSL